MDDEKFDNAPEAEDIPIDQTDETPFEPASEAPFEDAALDASGAWPSLDAGDGWEPDDSQWEPATGEKSDAPADQLPEDWDPDLPESLLDGEWRPDDDWNVETPDWTSAAALTDGDDGEAEPSAEDEWQPIPIWDKEGAEENIEVLGRAFPKKRFYVAAGLAAALLLAGVGGGVYALTSSSNDDGANHPQTAVTQTAAEEDKKDAATQEAAPAEQAAQPAEEAAQPAQEQEQTTEEHTHDWVAQTKTVHHDAGYETVHHDAEYTTVHHPAEYTTVHHDAVETGTSVAICNDCDFTVSLADISSMQSHCSGDAGHSGWHTSWIANGYEPAWDEQVLVSDAWDEQVETRAAYDEEVKVENAYDEEVVTGYKCSTCGETK